MRPLSSANPERRPANEVPGITGLRFMPQGMDAALINISSTGLLAESEQRLTVASPVQVQFLGSFSPSSAKGRIARCEVAVMGKDGLLRYHIAVEFDAPIPFADAAPEPPPPPATQSTRASLNRW